MKYINVPGIALFLLSGNPVLSSPDVRAVVLPAISIVILGSIVIGRPRDVSSLFWIVSVFGGIFLVQALLGSGFPTRAVSLFLGTLLIAYGCSRFSNSWSLDAVRTVSCFSTLSLPIWLWQLAYVVGGIDLGYTTATRFGLLLSADSAYSYTGLASLPLPGTEDAWRNAGAMWEPGAFCAYIVIALILWGTLRNEQSRRERSVTFGILLVTLLSTGSTTGYICLMLLSPLIVRELVVLAGPIGRFFEPFILMALIPAILIATQIELIAPKITAQWYSLVDSSQGYEITRLGNLEFDWVDIASKPLIGWGLTFSQRSSLAYASELIVNARSNGLSTFAAAVGIPALAFVVLPIIAYLYRATTTGRLLGSVSAITFLIVCSSQMVFNYPFVYAIWFFAVSMRNWK